MLKGKVLIAQGGGPTAVINQSLVGAILESRKFPGVEHVYGAQHGVNGIINENFLDLTQEPTANLEAVANTPCSALGSTRDKPDAKYCQEISRVLKAHKKNPIRTPKAFLFATARNYALNALRAGRHRFRLSSAYR